MFRYPIREISGIHGKGLSLTDRVLKADENPLSDLAGEMFDIDLRIDISRSTCNEVVLNLHGNRVKYDVKKRILHSHGSEVRLDPRDGIIEIRVLVDRLSIETFGNRGEVSITNIARQQDCRPQLVLNAVGGDAFIKSLDVHAVESTWKNDGK
jgi:fructan beta-fructosidase